MPRSGGDFLKRLQAVDGEARRDDVDIAQLRPLGREIAPDLGPLVVYVLGVKPGLIEPR
jgi:hypothetical protein